MGETYSEIPEYLIEWIRAQHMFWVASAPLSMDGHINISPKGVANTFHVASPTKVWYEDLSGSGAETIAHIRENRRVTILFNAFEGPPRIARLYGHGSFHEFGSEEYDRLLPPGTRQPGSRAVIVVDVYKVGTTCGYSVPYYKFSGHRVRLLDWAAKKEKMDLEYCASNLPKPDETCGFPTQDGPTTSFGGGARTTADTVHPNGMVSWWRARNVFSLDGLPALGLPMRSTLGIGSHKSIPKGLTRPVQSAHLAGLAPPSSSNSQSKKLVTPSESNSGPMDFRETSDIQVAGPAHDQTRGVGVTGRLVGPGGCDQQAVLDWLRTSWMWIVWVTVTVIGGTAVACAGLLANRAKGRLSPIFEGLWPKNVVFGVRSFPNSGGESAGVWDKRSVTVRRAVTGGITTVGGIAANGKLAGREGKESVLVVADEPGPAAWCQGICAVTFPPFLGYVLSFLLGVIFTLFLLEWYRDIVAVRGMFPYHAFGFYSTVGSWLDT
ncbi:hypothetical protein FA15DRAFT_705557 [Coprinopsis marcescibilis]|uniref:Uncharacterized protein n=1 Tax=Coprinopsis marcescibilis TaxID=230819 RepID=A0A5C3KSV8_COPMA|nr:hypothetical protein FA15DRAFT_705557 [Coprinopsis marcescibilis]